MCKKWSLELIFPYVKFDSFLQWSQTKGLGPYKGHKIQLKGREMSNPVAGLV